LLTHTARNQLGELRAKIEDDYRLVFHGIFKV
jgi:hypothetical protein